MRLRLALALSAVAAAAATAPAAAGHRTRPPELAGVTTLSGSSTGYVRVTIPRTARLGDPFFDSRRDSVTITGGGRVAAFALVKEGLRGPVIVGGHTDFTRADARSRGEFLGDVNGRGTGVDHVLPRGTYRLYLVPDGKPMRVTLRFAGLRGRTDLRPAERGAAVVQDGERLHPDDTKTVLSFGGDVATDGPTLRFTLAVLRVEAHALTDTSFCEYEGGSDSPTRYLPGCPGSPTSANILYSDEFVARGAVGAYSMALYRGEGDRYGSGVAVATASAVTAADAKQVWLTL